MTGEMSWLAGLGSNGEKTLHLRLGPHQPWRSYKTFREYAVPDYPIPGGSKGWATYQKLIAQGWNLVPCNQSEGERYAA